MDDTTTDSRRTNTSILRKTRAAISTGQQRSSAIAGRGAFNREISMPANWSINYCCRAGLSVSLSMRVTACSRFFFGGEFSRRSNFVHGKPTEWSLLLLFCFFILILIVRGLCKMKSAQRSLMSRDKARLSSSVSNSKD